MDGAHHGELVNRIRAELLERPLHHAALCPSWPRYVEWLRANGEPALACWLELSLPRALTLADRDRLHEVQREVLLNHGGDRADELRTLLSRGWWWWQGPFIVARIDAVNAQMNVELGRLTTFLTRDRWLTSTEVIEWLRGRPRQSVTLVRARLGEQDAMYRLLIDAMAVVDGRPRPDFPLSPGLRHGVGLTHHVVSLADMRSLDQLVEPEHDERIVVIGPDELLERWPGAAERDEPKALLPAEPLDPVPLLANPEPALFDGVRDELAARPLHAAHTCPSWPVLLDWLLARGQTLLAEWLRVGLDSAAEPGPAGDTARARLLQLDARLVHGPLVASNARQHGIIHDVWKQRRKRAHWLGPFVLAYVDPTLAGRIGAEQLRATLGVHATFLARARVHTVLDPAWAASALTPGERPVLAPVPAPNATLPVAEALASYRARERWLPASLRVARPGEPLGHRPAQSARDADTTVVLCCATDADVLRDAKAWRKRLRFFAHVLLLGTPEVLASWPHPAETLARPFPAAAEMGW